MMKQYFLSNCLLGIVFVLHLTSAFAHDLRTPRGSTVYHSHPADSTAWWDEPSTLYDYEGDKEYDCVVKADWTDWALDQWEDTYNLTLISPSNRAFNCHAYAWAGARENDSDTWCWISIGAAENFWTDGSYSEVSSSDATHVVEGDHSMVIVSGTTVTSKWCWLPVFLHGYNSHLYSSSSQLFLRKNPEVPSDYTSIQAALNAAKSGQIVHVDADSDPLTANITVPNNKQLQIHDNISLGSYYITTSGSGQIIVDSDVDYICIKAGSNIKYLYGSLTAACNNASSGETVEVHGTHSINDNATVPNGVTLDLSSDAVLEFASGKKLAVNGIIDAQYATFQSQSGTWYGIEFNHAASGSQVKYCNIRDAQYGIYMIHTDVVITGNIIEENTTGLLFEDYADGDGIVNQNVVTFNSSYGIRCKTYSDPLLFSCNVICDNGYGYGGVYGDASSIFDLGIYSDQGHNSIYYNDPYEVTTYYSGTIYARYNWWGESDPDPNLYEPYGTIDWSYYLTSDPNTMLAKAISPNPGPDSPIFKAAAATDTIGISEVDYAYLIYRKEAYQTAASLFETIVHKYPAYFSGRRALAFLYKCNKHLSNPIENLTLLDNVSTSYANEEIDALAKNIAAGELIKQGDYPTAIVRSEAVTNSFAKTVYAKQALFNLGSIYWYFLNAQKTGETYYRQLIAAYPDDDLSISALSTLGEWKPDESKPKQQPLAENLTLAKFSLDQNYPNPFNPATTIRYYLSETSQITIKIYNLLGEEVVTLADQFQLPGDHAIQWNGRDRFGNVGANGVYWLRLQVGKFVEQRKLVVLR